MKRIVCIGGGTGTSALAGGFRDRKLDVSAIISMADDGGSSGRLRRELGVHPVGDLRQCLLALSNASNEIKSLFAYRFADGELKGHSMGNLILAGLEREARSLTKALAIASDVLDVAGHVIPVTLDLVTLEARFKNGKKMRGEHLIDEANLADLVSMKLTPKARLNPAARRAILEADAIVIGPGGLHESLAPCFLVDGMNDAIAKSKATLIYVCNPVTKRGQTDGWSVDDHAAFVQSFLTRPIDVVIFNTKLPTTAFLKKIGERGHAVISGEGASSFLVGADLLASAGARKARGDAVVRSSIRYDMKRLADLITDFL